MDKIFDKNEILSLIESEKMVLLYFGDESCSVCRDIKPKIHNILDKYKNIKSIFISISNNLKLTRDFSIFTMPAILVYIEGKETIREARYLSIYDLEDNIDRYYNLLFN